MHPRRLIGTLLATALAATSLGVVATTAAPASAVDTVQTRIVPGIDGRPEFSSYSKPLAYGDDISVYVDVQAFVDGVWKDIYNGSVSVTERLASGGAPTTVASNTSAYVSDSFKARGKATYTVTYSGGTGEYPAVNYAPTSASYSIANVQRKIDVTPKSGRKLGLAGKVAPKGKVKLTVLQKHGKKWKKFKSVKTKGNGKFFVRLPAPGKRGGKLFWRIDIKGNSQFAPTKSGVYYTTKY